MGVIASGTISGYDLLYTCIPTYFAILLLLSRSKGQDYGTVKHKCDIVEFNRKYYDKQTLFSGYGRSFNLFLHELSGNFFFSRAIGNADLTDRQIMMCNNIKNICNYVKGVDRGYTIAYDKDNDEIFFGSPDGVYRYDYFLKKAKLVGLGEVAIWGIHVFEKYFYYIVHPTQRLYAIENYNFSDISLVTYTEVDIFHVSNHNLFYLSNKTALYRFKDKKSRVISNNTRIKVRQIAEDSRNNVYFAAKDGIYIYTSHFKKIMKLPGKSKIFGFTLVNLPSPINNLMIIYSNEKSIYRLIASDNSYCINEYIEKKRNNHEKKKRKNETLSLRLQVLL